MSLKTPAGAADDLLRYGHQPLEVFFRPKSVAVIGATETPGSVGRTLLWNLISSPFGGTVYPVNPKRSNVLGVKSYSSLSSLPDQPDLVVVVTPAATVPGLIRESVDAGARGAIVISAGFKEAGPQGVALEEAIKQEASRGALRVIGPNCLGVMNPLNGMNATFAGSVARPGSVAFLSQSGALCTSVLDWSRREHVGFSAFISLGSMLDVGWGELVDHLGADPHTRSIVIYMETIGDARSFLSAAREVALTKPIIVIKPGKTELAARAAASHTGSMTGSDEVLDAAFRRVGVLRVNTLADLFSMAEVLDKQPRPRGPRLTILTNAGGPGVLTTDALIALGGELAPLDAQTVEALNGLLPPHWSHANPIDILGDAGPERYAQALDIAIKDEHSDGMLVVLTPQAMTDPQRTAELLAPHATAHGKPLLASWMGGDSVAGGVRVLNEAGIPTFRYADTAARAFQYMWQYSVNLRSLYETPAFVDDAQGQQIERRQVQELLEGVASSGRTILTEYESKRLLEGYAIPTVQTLLALSEDESVAAAERLGYPVVLKLNSLTITHKTDVGGVQLNLHRADEVRQAFRTIERSVSELAGAQHFQGVTIQPMVLASGYELILGSSTDTQFGPVLLFGLGGQLVEVFKDRSFALPPLNTTLARRMIEQTKIFEALKGIRGRGPVDLAALEQLLVRFSQLVVEQPRIKEIEMNPLLASPEQLIALDARVILHDPDLSSAQLPHPAIRPYPVQYVEPWTMKDGTPVVIRPIRPEDEPLLVRFHETLSSRSVQLRYFHAINLSERVAHERLTRICFIDYDREMALVAEYKDPEGNREILGVGRLSKLPGEREAEFALLISDHHQGRGLGVELLRRLIEIGRNERVGAIVATILPDNFYMQRICRNLGFQQRHNDDEQVVEARLEL